MEIEGMFPLRKKTRPVMNAILQSLKTRSPLNKEELVNSTGMDKTKISSAIADLLANGEIKHAPDGKGYVLYMSSRGS